MRKYTVLGKSWSQISRSLDQYCQHWERSRKSFWSPRAPRFVRKSVLVGDTGTDAHFTYWTFRGNRYPSLLFLDIRHNELDWTCSINIESLYVGDWSISEEVDNEEFAEAVLHDLLKGTLSPRPKHWLCPVCGAVYSSASLKTRDDGAVQCQNCDMWVLMESGQASQATNDSGVHDQQ